MKTLLLTLAMTCLLAGWAAAQSYYQKEGSLYAEIFGNGGELSANFEKFLGRTASIKIGAGLTGVAGGDIAWVDHDKTKIGYEVPLTRHFYIYTQPRPLQEIDAEIKALEAEIQSLLAEVTDGP